MPKQNTTCLYDVPAGSTTTVSFIEGEQNMRGRLCALGITPGSTLQVFSTCQCKGTRRIKVRNASLVLDEQVAKSIMCECQCPQKHDLTPHEHHTKSPHKHHGGALHKHHDSSSHNHHGGSLHKHHDSSPHKHVHLPCCQPYKKTGEEKHGDDIKVS